MGPTKKKKFEINVLPSKTKKGITIIPKKTKVQNQEITIPAHEKIINKITHNETNITAKDAKVKEIKIPILPAEKKQKKEFKINVLPAKEKKGVEIIAKKGKKKNIEITIPAKKKIINKKIEETTHINMKNATINTITIPIEPAIVEDK